MPTLHRGQLHDKTEALNTSIFNNSSQAEFSHVISYSNKTSIVATLYTTFCGSTTAISALEAVRLIVDLYLYAASGAVLAFVLVSSFYIFVILFLFTCAGHCPATAKARFVTV